MPDTSTRSSITSRRPLLRPWLVALLVLLVAGALVAIGTCVPAALASHDPSSTTGVITIDSAWTAGSNGNTAPSFNPGATINYRANISNVSTAASVPFTWTVQGPCDTSAVVLFAGSLTIPAGGSSWTLPGTVAASACAGTYTFTVNAVFGGVTATKTNTYTVTGPTVAVVAAWTTNTSGTFDTLFSPGEGIRYRANFNNTGTVSVSAPVTWTIILPDNSLSVVSTSTLTLPAGGSSWVLSGTIPSTAASGTYILQVATRFNGQTSSAISEYTVQGTSTTNSVAVVSAWTAGSSGTTDTVFAPGDTIQYRANLLSNASVTSSTPMTWTVTGCGTTSTLFAGSLSVPTAGSNWVLPGTIATTACPGAYTFTVTAALNGIVSSQSSTYTISGSSTSVSANSAWAADANGNVRTVFLAGESIHLKAGVFNATGAGKSATMAWTLSGPCNAGSLWSGSKTTGANMWTWDLVLAAGGNSCAGDYTFTFGNTYGSEVTSKSVSFTVKASRSLYLPLSTDSSGAATVASVAAVNEPTGQASPVDSVTVTGVPTRLASTEVRAVMLNGHRVLDAALTRALVVTNLSGPTITQFVVPPERHQPPVIVTDRPTMQSTY